MPDSDETDRGFLIWLHARLEHVVGEHPLSSQMHRLRGIILSTPKDQKTPNDCRGCNSLEDLLLKLDK